MATMYRALQACFVDSTYRNEGDTFLADDGQNDGFVLVEVDPVTLEEVVPQPPLPEGVKAPKGG